MELESGHKVVSLSKEENEEQMRLFKGYTEGIIQLDPGRWFFNAPFLKYANKIYNFKVKSSDVIIMTFPKSGTTWTQEVVWTMVNNREFNHPFAHIPVNQRVPFLECDVIMDTKNGPPMTKSSALMNVFEMMCPGKNPEDGLFLQLAEAAPDPRIIKTHLPFSLLPKNMLSTCKVIFVAREPKDVCVSFLHHSRILRCHNYVGSVDQFVDFFVDDKVFCAPYWEIFKEALERKEDQNLHICYYEDMKKEPKKEFQRLNEFLISDVTDEQLDKIIEYTSFDVMKKREKILDEKEGEESIMNLDIVEKEGGFFRKGIVGDGKNKLTPEQAKKIDQWTEKNAEALNEKIKYYT